METTLFIDDDVLAAAKALAARQDRSLGEVISDLSRQALEQAKPALERNGLPLLAARSGAPAVTLEMVNALRDLDA